MLQSVCRRHVSGFSGELCADVFTPKSIDFWCAMKVFKLDENASSVAEVRKGKLGELEKKYDLDDDDYELLEDNGFRRSKVESKKFKRLKKAKADDDGGPPTDGIVEDEQPEEEEDGDTGEYEDEMADFFVNEEHMDEHGQPKWHTYWTHAFYLCKFPTRRFDSL
uniref:Transcription elongation factor SPT6 homolog n=1 Tax=Tanacetum cinerariifolium TaxID=118510 RepID=A0A6L2K488_TANCI|nr:transcription elongation factor SPT6 homolog [Tanacetum cinerariifolium]